MNQRKKIMTTIYVILIIIAAMVVAIVVFINTPQFGKLPSGARWERIQNSPNFKNGEFRNLEPTILMMSDKSKIKSLWDFVFNKPSGLIPPHPVKVVKENYREVNGDFMAWFGHSSYLLQVAGVRFLIDPVFYNGSPVSFVNKAFEGTNVFKPDDMPDIDYLIISHDHWDHLDYNVAKAMLPRVGHVVCPLGVGEHFEHWGYSSDKLIEMDWNEVYKTENLTINCLPARHFSGRGLKQNQSLWASYMLQTPKGNIFIGGDSGYGKHFRQIGDKFKDIDLAIIENGQYDKQWASIHCMPEYHSKVIADLHPKHVVTVHHSKYALANHSWDEPLKNEQILIEKHHAPVVILEIGKVSPLPVQ